MPTDLTLPGDFEGLLRPWSPVICNWEQTHDVRAVVVGVPTATHVQVCWPWHHPPGAGGAFTDTPPLECLALDLNDHTGRWHAALWAARQDTCLLGDDEVAELWEILGSVQAGDELPHQVIVRFRDLCLKIAGRAA